MTAQLIIEQLQLEPLPHEGGWFRRIHTDPATFPSRQDGSRALGSGIYFLITAGDFSAMHRLSQSVESFHWHAGDPAVMLLLYPDGSGKQRIIGPELEQGHVPSSIVPRDVWQGTRLQEGGEHGFALFSVMVTPEFLWNDFQLIDRSSLTKQYPEWSKEIVGLTRQDAD